MDKQISFVLPVVMDTSPEGTNFGDMIDDAKDTYTQVRNERRLHVLNDDLFELSEVTVSVINLRPFLSNCAILIRAYTLKVYTHLDGKNY